PLYLVRRGAPEGDTRSIRDDVLDRHIFATIPAFTKQTVARRVPLAWHSCDCDWVKLRGVAREDVIETLGSLDTGTTPDDIEHFPEKVESSLDESELEERQDAAKALREAGLTAVPPKHDACDHGRIVTKWHTYTEVVPGKVKRQCTGKYKVEPIERKIREL